MKACSSNTWFAFGFGFELRFGVEIFTRRCIIFALMSFALRFLHAEPSSKCSNYRQTYKKYIFKLFFKKPTVKLLAHRDTHTHTQNHSRALTHTLYLRLCWPLCGFWLESSLVVLVYLVIVDAQTQPHFFRSSLFASLTFVNAICNTLRTCCICR